MKFRINKKLDELSLKLKKVSKKFSQLLSLSGLDLKASDSKLFDFKTLEVSSRPLDENKLKKEMKSIQAEFNKLYIKISDQLGRVDQYLNELLTTSEFEQLAKKLESIGVSMNQLKGIESQRVGKMQGKRETEEL